MSEQENKNVVRRFLQQVEERNGDAAAQCIADDVRWWVLGMGELAKPDITGTHQFLFQVTDKISFEISDQAAEGDLVSSDLDVIYTFKDGRQLISSMHLSVTLRDGKLSRVREYFDPSMLHQFPAPGGE